MPEPRGRARHGAAVRSGRRRATSRSGTGWRAAPTASRGRAARWRTRSSPTSARSGLPGIDWEYALVHLHDDLRRNYGEDFLREGVAHPISHTLDLAYGYHCTARVARHVGDHELADHLDDARRALGATRSTTRTGLLHRLDLLRGRPGNYSFRLLHDMRDRIELAGGDDAFVEMLDAFFGYGASPVKPARRATRFEDELANGYALGPLRGAQQRARHGGAVGLPVRRPTRSHHRGGARRRPPAVRHRSWRPAGQRRLRRPQLLVRLGVARALPGRRPEPVPRQRSLLRPSREIRVGERRLRIETDRTSSSRTPAARPSTCSRSRSTATRSTAPGCAVTRCTAAADYSSSSARSRATGDATPARRRPRPTDPDRRPDRTEIARQSHARIERRTRP